MILERDGQPFTMKGVESGVSSGPWVVAVGCRTTNTPVATLQAGEDSEQRCIKSATYD